MTREKAAQIFTMLATLVESDQQPLDSVRNVRRGTAITDRSSDRSKLPDASADTEVIRVHHAAIHFDFFALDANIGDPMLPAAIWATRDIKAQLFPKIGEALFEFLGQPTGKSLGLSKRKLAELRARAGHGSTCEYRGLHRQGGNFKFTGHGGRLAPRHVDDQQVLHGGGSNVAVGVAVGKLRCRAQLLRTDPPSQHRSANVDKAALLLLMDADVVAVNIPGNFFRLGGIKRKTNCSLQFIQKTIRRPTLLKKQKLQPSLFPALPKRFTGAEYFRHAASYGHDLVPPNEGVQPQGDVRIGGESPTNPQ